MLLPLMVTLYIGGVEVSSAIAVDRKVTLVARTLGDLVAQSTSLNSTDMTNILNAATLGRAALFILADQGDGLARRYRRATA